MTIINTAQITEGRVFSQTMDLRVVKYLDHSNSDVHGDHIDGWVTLSFIEQRWVSPSGHEEWRMIPEITK